MKPRSAIKTDLFAGEHHRKKIDSLGDSLADIESHIDFGSLAAEVDKVAPRPVSAQGGRPPSPTETMVRILVAKALFDGVSAQLLRKGFIARGGQIIDATLVPAPKQHNSRGEKALIEHGAMPADWKPAKRRQKDIDATWTKKHGKSHFGYKLSINVDKKYKIIRRIETDTASTHDSRQLQRKGKRNKPLSECQQRCNQRIAKTRARVEHVLGALEQMGGKLLRTIGQARASFAMTMMAACYNLKRLVYFRKAGIEAF